MEHYPMRIYLIAIGLVIMILFLSTNARAFSADAAAGPSVAFRGLSTLPLEDVAVVWLYVIRQGRTHREAIYPEMLSKMKHLTVDGYVHGIVLLSTEPLKVKAASEPLQNMPTTAAGYYSPKYYDAFSQSEVCSTRLKTSEEKKSGAKILGRYSRFAMVPGGALTPEREFRLAISKKEIEYSLTIRQQPRVKLALDELELCTSGRTEIYYLGSPTDQCTAESTEFKKRINAFLAGIAAVEQTVGRPIVEQLHIIDFQEIRNAFTYKGKKEIYLYTSIFWNEPVEELRVIAEHEVMHILSEQLGLPESSPMRALFADLLELKIFSQERFQLMATGHLPTCTESESDSNPIFNFINEVNFIRGMQGGHSKDNIDEFCASFLHTMVYIDRLEGLLRQPVVTSDGSTTALTSGARFQLLKDYRKVLQTLLHKAGKSMPHRMTALLRLCLEKTNRIEKTLAAK